MRLLHQTCFAIAAIAIVPTALRAQDAGETSRAVAGGGISVPGWTGKIDANEEKAGQTLNSAKLAKDGNAFHVHKFQSADPTTFPGHPMAGWRAMQAEYEAAYFARQERSSEVSCSAEPDGMIEL